MNSLRYTTLFFGALLFASGAKAQKRSIFTDCSKPTAYRFVKGDTVLVGCDTVFLLNGYTFGIYQKFYNKGRSNSGSFKEVIGGYESIIAGKDEMLGRKELYYQQLKTQFDSLANSSKVFMSRTGESLNLVSQSLNKTTTQLTEAQRLLGEAKDLLADERKKRNKNALLFGVGGLVLGAAIAIIAVR